MPYITNLNFNIFHHFGVEQHRYVWCIFEDLGLIDTYSIPKQKLANFLTEAQMLHNKNNNPYHNYELAVTVTQSVYYNLLKTDIV